MPDRPRGEPRSDERRYHESEVEQIFAAAATDADRPATSASVRGALTLRELQEIGRQVGIEPVRIAEAARALDSGRARGSRFTLPTTVGRTAPLPRAPTQAEWLRLVTELRETFATTGTVGQTGGIFEWSDGNVDAFIEPTSGGYRLRLLARERPALVLAGAGILGIGWSAAVVVGLAITGELAADYWVPAISSVLGAGGVGAALARLRSWRRSRAEQLEHISVTAEALLGSGPEESEPLP